ncbi:hypothetical protein D1872_50890 [compost metagenome]
MSCLTKGVIKLHEGVYTLSFYEMTQLPIVYCLRLDSMSKHGIIKRYYEDVTDLLQGIQVILLDSASVYFAPWSLKSKIPSSTCFQYRGDDF